MSRFDQIYTKLKRSGFKLLFEGDIAKLLPFSIKKYDLYIIYIIYILYILYKYWKKQNTKICVGYGSGTLSLGNPCYSAGSSKIKIREW